MRRELLYWPAPHTGWGSLFSELMCSRKVWTRQVGNRGVGPPVRQNTVRKERHRETDWRPMCSWEHLAEAKRRNAFYSKWIGLFQGRPRRLSEPAEYSWIFQFQFPLFPKTCLPTKFSHVPGTQYGQIVTCRLRSHLVSWMVRTDFIFRFRKIGHSNLKGKPRFNSHTLFSDKEILPWSMVNHGEVSRNFWSAFSLLIWGAMRINIRVPLNSCTLGWLGKGTFFLSSLLDSKPE